MSDAAQTDRAPDRAEGDVNGTPARRAWVRGLGPRAAALLERDQRAFLRQALSTPCLNVAVGAAGDTLRDADGRDLLDFHGNSVHHVGYGHPRVVEAIRRQLDQLPFCPRRYTNLPAVELAERLGALMPEGAKVLLAPGGAAAVGIAMRLARAATGRHRTISFWGSFHGASLDAASIGGEAMFRRDAGPLLPGCEHVDPPTPDDCGWGCSGSCRMLCAAAVERVLAREGDVGAVIAEPMRCTTVSPAPAGYWRRVRDACRAHGALLIFDEIPLALGRTGRMFAFEHEDAAPDILVIGKALGGGVFPLAAVLAHPRLDIAPDRALGHYTHEKSPVGAAAAVATLDVIRDEGLVERSATLGRWALEFLRSAFDGCPLVRAVRGRGLLLGIELRTDLDPDAAEAVMYACMARGVSFKVSEGRVLTLAPPLNIDEARLRRGLSAVVGAVRERAGGDRSVNVV